ncbi:hypothetical protein [Methanobrevibacter sp.]|uniref:hypothetical protein n=1 Tax=Methanobrevibacter sp. TaxID=66852 RepID=UPI00389035AF
MNIPYYLFIDGECHLLHSRDNISELAIKLLTNKITEDEYRQFIEQCILKSNFNRK